MLEYFHTYVMELFSLGLEMSERGVRVDLDELEKIKVDLGQKVDAKRMEFDALAPGLNPRSPKQLKELLYETLKLPKQTNRKTGKVTTGEEALVALGKKFGKKYPVLQCLIDLREVEKMKSTYADVELTNGRLHTRYLITGTETGRFSSKKADDDEGLNMQNLPPWFRRVLIPDEGKVFLEGDLSQAEARIVAYLAGEEEMIAVFNTPGRNIHKLNASKIFGIKEEEVVKDSRPTEPYGKAKRVTHGFDYKLGARHAAEIAGVSVREMESLREAYFRAFPNILKWHKSIEHVSVTSRRLRTPFGRSRLFLGRPPRRTEEGTILPNEDLVRKMVAFVPQSTCTEYLKRGMLRAKEVLPEGAEFLMDLHDGFLLQCFEKDLNLVRNIVLEKTCIPLEIVDIFGNPRNLTIPLETKTGISWGEAMI